MPDRYFQHTFENGLTLLGEEMPGTQSAAMTMLVPAGSAGDPESFAGSATVLCDLILRGAGSRDNRALTEHLDYLGLQRSSGVGVYHSRLGCAAPAGKVMEGLDAFADILLRPHLPADGFDAARELSLQSLAGIEDEPQRKLTTILREMYFPWPLGRNSLGTKESLEAMTLETVRADRQNRYVSEGAIFAFAGNIDFEMLKNRIGELFSASTWPKRSPPQPTLTPPSRTYHFQQQASEQTHIGLAWSTVDEVHPDYYVARVIAEILGGGMSSRLFTEVREKRGLCYSVHAGYGSLKNLGCMMGYAGTSNDRAQGTLDCYLEALDQMQQGVTADELQRATIGLKANIVMSNESTGSRAGAIVHDWFTRGRIRTVQEIKDAIDAVTLDRVNEFLKNNPVGKPTIAVLGPKELKV